MVNVNKIKGKMAESGYTQVELAKRLGMTDATLYRKFKRGIFDSDEIEAMISILHIDNPLEIFFANDGTHDVPNAKN